MLNGATSLRAAAFEGLAGRSPRRTIRVVRVAVYTRLSLDVHGDQLATQRQQEACEKFAALREWTVAAVYEDVDLSAYKNVRRPAYERMLASLRAGDIDGVLVWKLDRLVRRPAEFERFWAMCESRGAFVASVTEPIDSSNELGLALVRILVTFAALESATTATRLRARNEQAARVGRAPNNAAYGFRKGWHEHEPAEAAILREIANRVLNGSTIASIRDDLNARGVPSPTGRPWTTTAISCQLRYDRLVGDRVYHGEVVATGCYPPILSREDFVRLGVILHRPGRQARAVLFSGVVVCGRCECRLYAGGDAREAGFSCNKRGGCGRVSVSTRHLTAHVLPRLFRHAGRMADPVPPAAILDTTAWASALRLASRSMSLAYSKLRDRDITYTDYLRERRRIEHELATITESLPTGSAVESAWPQLTFEQQRAVVLRDIERITVLPATLRGVFEPTRIRVRWWSRPDREADVTTSLAAALTRSRTRRGRHAYRWLDLEEAARELGGLSQRRVLRFVINGELPAFHEGSQLYFRAHEIDDFINSSRIVSPRRTGRALTRSEGTHAH